MIGLTIDPGLATIIVALIGLFGGGGWWAKSISKKIHSIDRSVNNIKPDEEPLIQRVRNIEKHVVETSEYGRDQRVWLNEVISSIATQLGITVPEPPCPPGDCE